jgi:undecaprenyl-diphosphatase
VNPTIALLILGLLQGLIEWLPVSSEGNLTVLAITLLGLEPRHALSVSIYLHIGTGLAALIYLRHELAGIFLRKTEKDCRMLRFLFISTVVTGLVGLPTYLFVRTAALYGEVLLALTGIALIATGLIQRRNPSSSHQPFKGLHTNDGVILGAIQGLSVLPGLSRSGLTSSALLFKGLDGEDALRISFLMSVPSIFAATTGLTLIEGAPPFEKGFFVAILASFLSGLLSIGILLRLAKKVSFWGLCIVLGLITLMPVLLYLV